MTKVSITGNQRVTLEAAARSSKLVAWPTPAKLKLNAGSATIVIKGLIKKGLLVERPELGEDAVWREDDEGRQLIVVITKTGMVAVGMASAAAAEGEAAGEPPASSGSDDEQPAAPPETSPTDGHTAPTAAVSGQGKAPPPGSKLAAVMGLLSRAEGATVEEMAAESGWQAHSVRGVMSGAPVKRYGLRISLEPVEGRGRVYRAG